MSSLFESKPIITRLYPLVAAADENYDRARDQWSDALSKTFPNGTRVRINHWRGSYVGVVVGRDSLGHRLTVRNEVTGKLSQPYPHLVVTTEGEPKPAVEIIDGGSA